QNQRVTCRTILPVHSDREYITAWITDVGDYGCQIIFIDGAADDVDERWRNVVNRYGTSKWNRRRAGVIIHQRGGNVVHVRSRAGRIIICIDMSNREVAC